MKKAEKHYLKTLEVNNKNIYEKYYGMKITNSAAMPQTALRFMRPLSSEEKDLTHKNMIGKIQAAAAIAADAGLETEYLKGSKQLHLLRINHDGSFTKLKISPTFHPGRSILEIDGVKVASGWNDKIAVIAERFIKGKNLKFTVNNTDNGATDLIFKPVGTKMEKFCTARGYAA